MVSVHADMWPWSAEANTKELAEALKARSLKPAIIAGDLNATPQEKAVGALLGVGLIDVLRARREHVVDRRFDVGVLVVVEDRHQVLDERHRLQVPPRAHDRGSAGAAVLEHRHGLGQDRRPAAKNEQLAEVARLDELAGFDARETDRPAAPRIIEVAVAGVLDHERDLVVREHEVAVAPGD